MVIHFVNLCCWREVKPFVTSGDVVHCDSVTMWLLILVLSKKSVKIVSGVKFFSDTMNDDMSFLLAYDFVYSKKIILPRYDEGNIYIYDELDAFVSNMTSSVACIGISSPKQNELAMLLNKMRSDLKYLCLGAAIYQRNGYKPFYDHLHINWIYFFGKNPIRSCRKIILTFYEIFNILNNYEVREDFLKFVSSYFCENDQN